MGWLDNDETMGADGFTGAEEDELASTIPCRGGVLGDKGVLWRREIALKVSLYRPSPVNYGLGT